MLQPGQVVDRFTVESVLGRGGMAVVYLVRHNTLDSLAALKVLTLTGPVVRERLMQEGRVQAGLRHPNIVSVFDVLAVDGATGLLIEYVDGLALDRFLARGRPPRELALEIFDGILSGVDLAHRRGLVHRDLKPGNVLLADVDGRMVPKVTDFGLVKIVVDQELGDSFTRSGAPMGTPQYMAPEQIRDAKNVDKRADIFSLGCLLFELVCGRPPFQGSDMLDLFNSIAGGNYPDPRSLVPDLPDAVVAAIGGCLRPARDERLPDCEAVRRALAGASLPASPTPHGQVPPVARSPSPVAPARTVDSGTMAGMLDFGSVESIEVPAVVPPVVASPVSTRPAVASPPPTVAAPVSTMDATPSLTVEPVVPARFRWWGLAVIVAVVVGVGGYLAWPHQPAATAPGPVVIAPAVSPAAAEAPPPEPSPRAPPVRAQVAPTPQRTDKPDPVSPPVARVREPSGVAPAVASFPAEEPPPPEQAPAAPLPGRFQVSSEGAAAYLLAEDGGRHLEGTDVPAGRYAVRAMLDGRTYVPAGHVEIRAGQTTRVTCSKTMMTCRAE